MNMNQDKIRGLLALLTASFLGGAIMPSLIRTGVSTIHPFTFTFFRSLISLLILLPFSFGQLKKIKIKQISLMASILGLSMAGNTILFSFGVSHTTLVVSQLMYAILPITTGIVGFLFLKESIGKYKIVGSLLAIIGVSSLIIFSQDNSRALSIGTFYGNSIILLAVFSYTLFMIFSKKFSKNNATIVLATLSNLGASLVSFPLGIYFLGKSGIENISTVSWLSAIGIGLISAAFIFLTQFGLKRLSTVTSAITAQLNPEFAAIVGIIVYHEKISLALISSLLLVSGGVMLSLKTHQSLWQKILAKLKISNHDA